MPEPAPPVTADLTPPLGAGFPDRAAEAGVDVRGALSAGERHRVGVEVDGELAGRELGLSPRQVELLALFVAAPRRVWSRTQLHWVIWGDTAPSRRVDVQLCRLRARTGVDLFRNVRDRGWTLRAVA